MSKKKQYDDLYGGVGRAMNFRAKRVLAREVADLDGFDLTVDGKPAQVHDLAMSGLSFHTPPADSSAVGDAVELRVCFAEQVIFEGAARVARIEDLGRSRRIAVQLLTGFLDLPAIRRADEDRTLQLRLGTGADKVRDKVPADFREVNEHAAFFLAHHRRLLDETENRYREQGANGRELIDRLVQQASDAMRPEWLAISSRAGEIARPYLEDAETRAAMKAYVETLITSQLLDVPIVSRAYTKPLGYAGDYQVMNLIFRNAYEGRTVFSRVINKLFVEESIAEGARARLELLKKIYADELARRTALGASEPFRIMSLGCGPAKEVSDFADGPDAWPTPIHWTLLDQDEQVLSLAYSESFKRLTARRDGSSVRCLYMSFQQLIADPEGSFNEESHDLVYASGLYDYLRQNRARELTRALYDKTSPGGLCIIANGAAPSKSLWPTEFILDWTLIYRTEAEMRDIADALPADAEVEFTAEREGAFSFLIARKPG